MMDSPCSPDGAERNPGSRIPLMRATNKSPRQRDRLAACRLALEARGRREGEARERLAGVIADHQRALVEGPAPAGEEVARAAAFRRDGAVRAAGRPRKGDGAGAAGGG